MRIKKFDFVIIGIVILLGVIYMFFQGNNVGSYAEIYSDGELYGTYSLNKDTVIDIESEFGTNKVVIEKGRIFVSEASCPDKNDVKQGKINKSGQSIICLPNRLIISIKGGEIFDALSY